MAFFLIPKSTMLIGRFNSCSMSCETTSDLTALTACPVSMPIIALMAKEQLYELQSGTLLGLPAIPGAVMTDMASSTIIVRRFAPHYLKE